MSGRPAVIRVCIVVVTTLTAGCAFDSPTQPTSFVGSGGVRPTTAVGAMPALTDHASARTAVAFTLSACPSLPAGVSVSGSGESFLVTNSRVDADGVTHIERNDHVTGTATDSNGASYRFNYHNHSNIAVPAGGFPWSFTTTDHFNLVGNGKADRLHVSFVARVTFPSPGAPPSFEFVNERGNPFFCDPI